jgi:hypothetical protein
MAVLYCNWTNPPVGSNFIQVIDTNAVPMTSGTRSVIVTPPLVMSAPGGADDQFLIWQSAPGATYQVLATTNLSQPFQPISGTIPSQGATTTYYDSTTNGPQKFYKVEMQ